MSVSEILDASLDTYRLFGWSILRIAAWPSVACFLATVFLIEFIVPSLAVTSSPDSVGAQLGEALFAMGVGLVVCAPLLFFGLGFAGAAITSMVSDYLVGQVPSLAKATEVARSSVWRLVGLSAIQAAVSMAGLFIGLLLLMAGAYGAATDQNATWSIFAVVFGMFGIVLGFGMIPFLLAYHALSMPAMVVERVGIRHGLKRARELMKSRTRQGSGYGPSVAILLVSGFLFLFVVLGLVGVSELVGLPNVVAQLAGPGLVGMVVGQVVDYGPLLIGIWIVIPVWCASTTILYFERRVRLEGFDIDALAKGVWSDSRSNRFEL